MTSLYEISESIIDTEYKNFHDAFYTDVLYFIEQVNTSKDAVQFLNSIDAEALDSLFIKSFRKLSNSIEKTINKMYLYALKEHKIEPEIKRKYGNIIITSEEIHNYLDNNCKNLWQELLNWNNNHQSFINYHNESGNNAFDAGYGGGAIGATIGSIFGPVGTIAGSLIGGYLAGSSVGNEYDSNFKILMTKYENVIKEFDNSWVLICENLIPVILSEVDSRYEEIKQENIKFIREKSSRNNIVNQTNIKYLPESGSNINNNKTLNNQNHTNNNPIIYILASALIFMIIFVLLILTKVIQIN